MSYGTTRSFTCLFATLCSLRCMRVSSGHCDASDLASMLQGPAQSLLGSLLPQRSSDEARTLEKDTSWQKREYHLVPHHKSGSAMCSQAARYMQAALANASASPFPLVQNSPETMGLASEPSMLQSPRPTCIAQFARNPFEMVVSGYLYHMAVSNAERFLLEPLGKTREQYHDGCEPLFSDGRMTNTCKDKSNFTFGEHLYLRGIAQVFNSTLSGPASAWLPRGSDDETYPQYLKRVDVDAGLIAAAIWAYDATLVPMRFTHEFVQSQPCSINVCFNEFYEKCNDTWHRVLQAWQLPQPQHGAMLRAATKSCPAVSPKALSHSSHQWMDKQDLTHPPEHEMVSRLRELDRIVLNGKLATVENHLKCPVSGKYKEAF